MTRNLLDKVHQLRKDINGEWFDELDKFNIAQDISPIYNSTLINRKKNLYFAYIVLAYHNSSEWMEVHKDRYSTKLKILQRLGADIKDQEYIDIAAGKNAIIQKVVQWFCIWQTDYRWNDIRACFEYHSEMMMFAGVQTPSKRTFEEYEIDEEGVENPVTTTEDIDMDKQIAFNIKKSQCIQAGQDMRARGNKMLEDIQREYVVLDTALHKEGVTRITETVDIIKWEPFIRQLRSKVID
jgi:hypothetical protein